MRHKEIIALAAQLEENWEMYQSEAELGSGGDRITLTHEFEKEFFDGECFDLGLTDEETNLIMKQLGFS